MQLARAGGISQAYLFQGCTTATGLLCVGPRSVATLAEVAEKGVEAGRARGAVRGAEGCSEAPGRGGARRASTLEIK